jgi:hypothetical protein
MMAFTNTCSGFWKYKNKFAWFEKKKISKDAIRGRKANSV